MDLPIEILAHIALQDCGYVYREMLSVPLFARFTIYNQSYLRKTLSCIEKLDDGSIRYYLFGKLHRDDGPAVQLANGDQQWFYIGKLHRSDGGTSMGPGASGTEPGPAIVCKDTQEWWYHGKRHRSGDQPAIVSRKMQVWYHHGLIHRRNDMPAMIQNGDRMWYRRGKLHRESEPAVIYGSGERQWWFNGQYYRDDFENNIFNEINDNFICFY